MYKLLFGLFLLINTPSILAAPEIDLGAGMGCQNITPNYCHHAVLDGNCKICDPGTKFKLPNPDVLDNTKLLLLQHISPKKGLYCKTGWDKIDEEHHIYQCH